MVLQDLANLGLRALGMNASPFFAGRDVVLENANDMCVVYTVFESPVSVSTCFSTPTTATLAGLTSTIASPTCIDTTVTFSSTLSGGVTQTPIDTVSYTTVTVDTLTTYCPSSTTLTQGTNTYTITSPTTLTITDCPCTHSYPISESTPCEYTTFTTDTLITTCRGPTTFTQGSKIYTVTDSTTMTITDCPCTYSRPVNPTSSLDHSAFPSPSLVVSPTGSPSMGSPGSPSIHYPDSSTTPIVTRSAWSPSISPRLSSTAYAASISVGPVVSSTGLTNTPVTSGSSSTTTSTTPSGTSQACGAAVGGSNCNNSEFGNCCGSDNTCGHDAAHCGNGCQSDFGYCTNTSNDGTCGNGVTCLSSPFGNCCSSSFFCGSGPDYCNDGCQPEYGTCDGVSSTSVGPVDPTTQPTGHHTRPPHTRSRSHHVTYTTVTTSILTTVCPSSTTFTMGLKTYTVTESTTLTITDCPCTYSMPVTIVPEDFAVATLIAPAPSATAQYGSCQASSGASFQPGTLPDNIGNAQLASLGDPSVFTYEGTTYSFGFQDLTVGSPAYAETNATTPATDGIAFYQVPADIDPPTKGCSNFGYLYDVPSGLCLSALKTENAYPEYQGADIVLEPCQCSGDSPPMNQAFCTDKYTEDFYTPYQCMLFYGDTKSNNSFYGPTYGAGPGWMESTVMIDGGECIFVKFS